jgi:hypothetical protein
MPCDYIQKATGVCWTIETLLATLNHGAGCTEKKRRIVRLPRLTAPLRGEVAKTLQRLPSRSFRTIRTNRLTITLPKIASGPRKKKGKGRGKRKKT